MLMFRLPLLLIPPALAMVLLSLAEDWWRERHGLPGQWWYEEEQRPFRGKGNE